MKAQKNQEKVYLSFDFQNYTRAKSTLLRSEIDLLNSMKRLHNIERITAEEARLKSKLAELFNTLSFYLGQLEEKIPSNVIHPYQEKQKNLKKEFSEIAVKPKSSDKTDNKISNIENELLEIQEKLRKMNALQN